MGGNEREDIRGLQREEVKGGVFFVVRDGEVGSWRRGERGRRGERVKGGVRGREGREYLRQQVDRNSHNFHHQLQK